MQDNKPLAERLRPYDFAEFIGQGHLKKQIETFLSSRKGINLLLFGPPGCGKSTLAIIMAKSLKSPYLRISASEAGISDLRKKISHYRILILDEIHRFSKAQQDFFLPLLESGEILLLATTTENPSFTVTTQLLSRMHILRLEALKEKELMHLAERGRQELAIDLPEESLHFLVRKSQGDARTLLNLLEFIQNIPTEATAPEELAHYLPEILQRNDRMGDTHYELASALIKSIRGSDPDAALYYLAAMLEGGEYPGFICRRLILSAAEDVGLADPQALDLAVSCAHAVEYVGMPEGFIPMAETVTYLALAPKSNSAYAAYLAAKKEIQSNGPQPVPFHLRNPSSSLHKEWGYGKEYKYPHIYPGAWVKQQYLPGKIKNAPFYKPKDQGLEPKMYQWLKEKLKKHGIQDRGKKE